MTTTAAEVGEMLLESSGMCQSCGDEFKSQRDTHLDHDHSTGAARGFICGKCNVALGMAGDSPETLRKLANYLDRHNAIYHTS